MYIRYDANGEAIGFRHGGVEYTYMKNLQGDITGIVAANGDVVVKYNYDAYGRCLVVAGTQADTLGQLNPLRYRGYVYDSETELYYLQSRYYDPEMGRFLNADVVYDESSLQGFNVFIYCGNSPIVYSDYDGYGRTYVIYYAKPPRDFTKQAKNSPYYNSNSKNVYLIPVRSRNDFIKAWNGMSGSIDYVYLYLHGGKGKLYFYKESMGFSGGKSFKNLRSKVVRKMVFLLSCSGGAGKEGNNVAWMFAKLTGSKVRACTGSVSYQKFGNKYYARKSLKHNGSLDWGYFNTYYYERQYVYWGKYVARRRIIM